MAKKETYFKERRAFLERLVPSIKKGQWPREMKFTKDLFEKYPVDFLMVVKPPPFPLNSLAYLINGEGEKYLVVKLREFQYRPEIKKAVPQGKKIGEDANIPKVLTLREFLHGEKSSNKENGE